MSNSNVILMCGISGSGKTTYAKRLEDKGFTRLSLDRLMWNRYGEEYMKLPVERQRELSASVEDELKRRLLSEVEKGHDVVVDMCMCKRTQRDNYRKMLSETGANVELHYCHADLETLKSRISERNSSLGPDAAFVSMEMLERFNNGFQIPDDDELAKDISAL